MTKDDHRVVIQFFDVGEKIDYLIQSNF